MLAKNYFASHLQAFFQSVEQLKKTPLSSSLLLAMIAIALSLPLCLWVIAANGQQVLNSWHHSSQISVFLDSELSQTVSKVILDEIRELPEIAFANYISPQQGLKQLEEQTGIDDVVGLLENNPLPSVVEVQPVDIDKEHLSNVIQTIKKFKGVSQVKMDVQWLLRLEAMVHLAKRVALALMALLSIAVLLVIGNSIRLVIASRRQEIKVLKLIGATNSYIRRPFIHFGMLHGFLGAVLAWGLVSILILGLQSAVSNIAELYYTNYRLTTISLGFGFLLMILGAFLGGLGARVSVWHQLRKYEF